MAARFGKRSMPIPFKNQGEKKKQSPVGRVTTRIKKGGAKGACLKRLPGEKKVQRYPCLEL